MGNIWLDSITAVLATQPVGAAPTGDPGYGSDISCTDDIDSMCTEVSGDSPTVVAQAIYRRLTTPRGGLIDDLDYGMDIRSYLRRGMTRAQLAAMQSQIKSECLKDERVGTVTVTITSVGVDAYSIAVSGACDYGPFRLAFALTDAGTAIKEIS